MPCSLAPTSLRKRPHGLRCFARGRMAGGVGAPTFPTLASLSAIVLENGAGGGVQNPKGAATRPLPFIPKVQCQLQFYTVKSN
eukprot:796784-Prymnesium_polylepis.1